MFVGCSKSKILFYQIYEGVNISVKIKDVRLIDDTVVLNDIKSGIQSV